MNLHMITSSKVETFNVAFPQLKNTVVHNFFIAAHKSLASLKHRALIPPIKPDILKKQIKAERTGAQSSVFKDHETSEMTPDIR